MAYDAHMCTHVCVDSHHTVHMHTRTMYMYMQMHCTCTHTVKQVCVHWHAFMLVCTCAGSPERRQLNFSVVNSGARVVPSASSSTLGSAARPRANSTPGEQVAWTGMANACILLCMVPWCYTCVEPSQHKCNLNDIGQFKTVLATQSIKAIAIWLVVSQIRRVMFCYSTN